MVTELVKYLRNYYLDRLMLAEDSPALKVIKLLKYFHDFTEFIHKDSKTPAPSCSNTSTEVGGKRSGQNDKKERTEERTGDE